MAETIIKTVLDVDKLFSEIEVNGENHVSERYEAPPATPVPTAGAVPPAQNQTSTSTPVQNDPVQGADVYAVELNDVLHNFVDRAVTEGLQTEVTARQQADSTLQGNINSESISRYNADQALEGEIDSIEEKIPSQASAQNQLADKNFVNSSIATNTANFLGTYTSLADIEAIPNPTNNDYAFLETADASGNNIYDRYKYSAEDEEWLFEYELNNSSFTAEQWATINSGITQVTNVVQAGNYNPVTSDAVREAIDNSSSGTGIEVYDSDQDIIDDLPNLHSGDIVASKSQKDINTGVPLGTWASFVNDSAPNGEWLESGSTFNANTYPALAMMLGGNVVPIMYDHSRPSDYEAITLSTSSSSPTVMEYDGEINIYGGEQPQVYVNGVRIAWISWSSQHSQNATFTVKKGDSVYLSTSILSQYVRYYKHPMFIKATPTSSDTDYQGTLNGIRTYVSNSNSYSTEEVATGGTWIDGKPIYRKVVSDLNISFTSSFGWTNTGVLAPTNLGLIINSKVLSQDSATDYPTISEVPSFVTKRNSDGLLYLLIAGNYSGSVKALIIEYTKTN